MELKTSETTKELTAALVEFKKKVGTIGKKSDNPFYKSKYADLATILTAVDDHLCDCNLAVSQWPVGENGLTTRLMHTSGEWMEGTYVMEPKDHTPQGQGSAITYQRRYAIGAILSLNIDKDDDGNAASGKREGLNGKGQSKTDATVSKATPAQVKKELNAMLDKLRNMEPSEGEGHAFWLETLDSLGVDLTGRDKLDVTRARAAWLKMLRKEQEWKSQPGTGGDTDATSEPGPASPSTSTNGPGGGGK